MVKSIILIEFQIDFNFIGRYTRLVGWDRAVTFFESKGILAPIATKSYLPFLKDRTPLQAIQYIDQVMVLWDILIRRYYSSHIHHRSAIYSDV